MKGNSTTNMKNHHHQNIPSLSFEASKTLLQSSHSHHFLTQTSSSKTFHQENDGTRININGFKCTSSSSNPTHKYSNDQEMALHGLPGDQEMKGKEEASSGASRGGLLQQDDCGRERLKRHRVEVAGRVWIPDIWGQEELLKDWIDCSAFDAPLMPNRIMSARAALVEEGRRATSARLRIENRC